MAAHPLFELKVGGVKASSEHEHLGAVPFARALAPEAVEEVIQALVADIVATVHEWRSTHCSSDTRLGNADGNLFGDSHTCDS